MAKKRSRSKKAGKKYQIELTPLSIFLWGGCLFFVLAWIFVLGILVGRGFLPGAVTAFSDLKNQISVLQEMVSRNRSHDLSSPKKSDSDPKLAFYEKLSSKKEEAKKEWVPERSVESQKQPKPSAPELQYTVQLASLGDKSQAEKLIKDLVGRGYPAYFYEIKVNGQTYYRIRCGRFPSRQAAADYARKLGKEAGIKGFVSKIE